jgi:hypothetical protein
MFCPLCQSEYRDGFTQCSDCHLDLVASVEDVRSSAVRLWEGESQKDLDRILSALDARGIPCRWKEQVKPVLNKRFSFAWRPVKAEFRQEVWVLRSDSERARATIAGLVN